MSLINYSTGKKGQFISVDSVCGVTKMKLFTLQKAYDKALNDKKIEFTITDAGKTYDFITAYAKYLLEYLRSQGLKEIDEINFERKD